jgi:hypothetical protein
MTGSNWTPASANGNMTLTWDKENTRISPGQSVPAILTLSVSPTIVDITDFSVQINVIGTN